MGTAERREREKEQRRMEIIHAAEKVFFSKGFESAKMDDVATEAELSKGTLYLYFKSKEEVYMAIVLKAMKLLREMFDDVAATNENGLCKVRKIGEAYIHFNKEYPNYYNALLYFSSVKIDEEALEGSELKAFIENKDVMDVFVTIIEEGIKDGSLRQDLEPNKTALLLWGQTSGMLQLFTLKGHAISAHFNVDPDEMIKYYLEFTYHSLKAVWYIFCS